MMSQLAFDITIAVLGGSCMGITFATFLWYGFTPARSIITKNMSLVVRAHIIGMLISFLGGCCILFVGVYWLGINELFSLINEERRPIIGSAIAYSLSLGPIVSFFLNEPDEKK